jgi:superfamily II DNA/RNA helicase
LNLCDDLLRGIYAYGFENPSAIQGKAIVPFLLGRDIIGQAQSGTGKTGAFSISVLQKMDVTKGIQALILAPTRELVNQIYTIIGKLSSFMKKLRIYSVVGGNPVRDDISHIRDNNPHIIVGTPGRVYDLLQRNSIKYKEIRMVVMDEADELLSPGFKSTLQDIIRYIDKHVQIALFTATIPEEILDLTRMIMIDPFTIMLKADELSVEGINHHFITVHNDFDKYRVLKDLFSKCTLSQCIIYVNNVTKVIELHRELLHDDYPVSYIHGGMTKEEREEQFALFQKGSSRFLISSNITARGIDIQQVGLVINFDIPYDVHTYLHRIGRAGRYGRKGVAINLLSQYDVNSLKKIEKHYGLNITQYECK